MKVLNLRCDAGHAFEGWFASQAAFDSQCASNLMQCPVCGSSVVQRLPNATRFNVGPAGSDRGVGTSLETIDKRAPNAEADRPSRGTGLTPEKSGDGASDIAPDNQTGAGHLQALRRAIAQAEDVGDAFADEARRMHRGDRKMRSIRGQVGAGEARALAEEGIEAMVIPPYMREPLH